MRTVRITSIACGVLDVSPTHGGDFTRAVVNADGIGITDGGVRVAFRHVALTAEECEQLAGVLRMIEQRLVDLPR